MILEDVINLLKEMVNGLSKVKLGQTTNSFVGATHRKVPQEMGSKEG